MTKNNQNGQTLVEYVLIIALITVIAVGLVKFLGGSLKDSMTKTACNVAGKNYVEGSKAGEAYCEGDSILP